ncbi:MAG: hypothetical protein GY811_14710 [Myxococcales bacterium]|nr:hypothetical protein [Myxococcales bacterium]
MFVTVAGTYDREYWGLYIKTEQIDKTFQKDRFANTEGTLYKRARFQWFGNQVADYVPVHFEPKTNETGDHSPILELVTALNMAPDATFKTDIESIIDVDSFLSWLAANTLLGNMDNVVNRGGSSGYLYRSPDGGKFSYIVWDMNGAFGAEPEGLTNSQVVNLDIDMPVVNPGSPSPIIGRILAVPEFHAAYLAKLQTLVDGPFLPASMHANVDALRALTRPAALLESRKDYSGAQYDASFDQDVTALPSPPRPANRLVPGLKTFITARHQSVSQQLAN